jgi:Protein of unknown function (DUF2752)
VSRIKLYYLVLLFTVAGYAWIAWNYKNLSKSDNGISVCMFKNITGLPCPSCGTTHSVFYVIQGKPMDAFNCNPLGFIIVIILIIFPLWIISDLILRKNSFHSFYNKSEIFLKKKWVALPAIIFVLIIWILNIKKSI